MPSALGLWGQPLACQGSSEKTLTTNLWPWQPPLSQSICDSENVSCVSGDGIHAYLENHLENLWKPFSLPKKIWERERRGKAILFLARHQVCGDVVFDHHLKRIMNDPFSNSCQCFLLGITSSLLFAWPIAPHKMKKWMSKAVYVVKLFAIVWVSCFKWLTKTVCSCLLSCFSHVWLCDPLDCSLPSSSVHGIILVTILEWVAISSSRGSFQSRDWPCIPCGSCLWQEHSFPLSHQRSPPITTYKLIIRHYSLGFFYLFFFTWQSCFKKESTSLGCFLFYMEYSLILT